MKTLIVYYSLSGNCKLVAKTLKSSLNAEILEIKTLKDNKRPQGKRFMWGISQMIFNRKPALMSYTFNPDDWDLIILGTPVWAGGPAPAMVSFLNKSKISGKKIALYSCFAGNTGKAIDKLKVLLAGNSFVGELGLKNPSQGEYDFKEKINEWAKTLTV